MIEVKFDQAQRKKILDAMKEVEFETRKRLSLNGLRKAADIIVEAAQRDAQKVDDPTTRNHIVKNIVRSYSRRHFQRTGNQMYRVGIMGGARVPKLGKADPKTNQNPGYATFYWRFVNFGFTTRGGGRKIAGKHFFGNQLERYANKCVQVYADTLDRGLTRAVNKAKRGK